MNEFEKRREWVAKIAKAIESGTIETASRATLTEYSTWLCTPLASGEFGPDGRYEQICEIVRIHMLRTMIDAFEDRSKIMQWWLLFFAVLAIAATLMPYIIQPNPIFGAKPSPTESTARTAQGSAPTQASIATVPTKAQPPIQRSSRDPGNRESHESKPLIMAADPHIIPPDAAR